MAPAIDIEPGCANRMNAINVISPYKHHGMWVFDDARVGLVQEPAGADTWIDRVVADIPNAVKGFTLIFSSAPFPGYQYRLDWRRAESGGNWYYSADLVFLQYLSMKTIISSVVVPLVRSLGLDDSY